MVNAAPEPASIGLPVAIKKTDGEIVKKEAPPPAEDEDEDDSPTTVMPFGSSLAHEIRASMEAQYDEEAAAEAPAPPTPPRNPATGAVAPNAAPNAPLRDTLRSATPPAPAAEESGGNLAKVGIGLSLLVAIGVVVWGVFASGAV